MSNIYTSLYSVLLFSAVVSWLTILSFYFKPSGFLLSRPQIIDCTFLKKKTIILSVSLCVCERV